MESTLSRLSEYSLVCKRPRAACALLWFSVFFVTLPLKYCMCVRAPCECMFCCTAATMYWYGRVGGVTSLRELAATSFAHERWGAGRYPCGVLTPSIHYVLTHVYHVWRDLENKVTKRTLLRCKTILNTYLSLFNSTLVNTCWRTSLQVWRRHRHRAVAMGWVQHDGAACSFNYQSLFHTI